MTHILKWKATTLSAVYKPWSNWWIEVDICKRVSVNKILSQKSGLPTQSWQRKGQWWIILSFCFLSSLFPLIRFNFPLIFILISFTFPRSSCPSISISLSLRLLSGRWTEVRVEAAQPDGLRHQERPHWEAEDLPGAEWRQRHYLLSNSRGYHRARGWRSREILQNCCCCNHHQQQHITTVSFSVPSDIFSDRSVKQKIYPQYLSYYYMSKC